ncbi:Pr6Pr family membrane protein [Mucilaginibacter sp.]|uniref:Pr6Pr family membrane protein n=1 Tax=Mucilaginibacter sp. TaxID=1882438 RepID=UPI0035BC910E
MSRPYVKTYRICAGIIGLLAVLGVVLQFNSAIPMFIKNGRSTAGAMVDFFSYFTIQTNILVAIALGVMALTRINNSNFFKRPGVVTALAAYISIVCLVYNLVLRPLTHYTGIAKLGDELVHSIVPVLFIIYWLTAVLKETITWKDTLTWLWYPFFYLVYIIIRGALTGLYPYFFVDVTRFGYPKVLFNSAILLIIFLIFSLLYVAIARGIQRTHKAL